MTKKRLIGERFLPHYLVYCSPRLVYFCEISHMVVYHVYQHIVTAFMEGTTEYQVATACQAETKTPSDGNVDPEFSSLRPVLHSPHVSTTVCPAIYAIAIAAIGHVTSTTPVAAAAPATAVTPSLRLATLSMIPLIFPIMVVTYI